MGKFASSSAPPNVHAPVRTDDRRTPTCEAGIGYTRDPRSELFLLAVSNMVREHTFYEAAAERDRRFEHLIAEVTASDPTWVQGFVPYLRAHMQMRSAAVVLAAEYVHAGGPNGRQVVNSALQRADEPAEMLAYWYLTHGRRVPKPVKRGIADAVRRLYTERAALKYDGSGNAWRMGDVIDLVHPRPVAPWQSALFRWLLDRRHGRESLPGDDLPMLRAAMALDDIPPAERRGMLSALPAGMTWERLSGWLQGPMDAAAWEAVIPQMGYMALLRNLRTFEQAGVSPDVLGAVAHKLADPAEVAASRQFPIRFYAAFGVLPSERFSWVLEQALEYSLTNIPRLAGRTLVLIDVSGSMVSPMSKRSSLLRSHVAGLFGIALAKQCEAAQCYAYNTNAHPVAYSGGSVLRAVNDLKQVSGGGTQTFSVLSRLYDGQDRVVILTDEQTADDDRLIAHIDCPIYTFNVAGYAPAQTWNGRQRRYAFGGLTDAGFQLIQVIEETRDGRWPWVEATADSLASSGHRRSPTIASSPT